MRGRDHALNPGKIKCSSLYQWRPRNDNFIRLKQALVVVVAAAVVVVITTVENCWKHESFDVFTEMNIQIEVFW